MISEALRGRIDLLVSTALWLEYEAVIKRPEHWVSPGFDATEADRLLDLLANISIPVAIRFNWRGFLHDPDDDMVLEAAINGRADYLVTFNDHDFAPATVQLGLEVRRPDAILALLKDHP